jgi:hypothetical protein
MNNSSDNPQEDQVPPFFTPALISTLNKCTLHRPMHPTPMVPKFDYLRTFPHLASINIHSLYEPSTAHRSPPDTRVSREFQLCWPWQAMVRTQEQEEDSHIRW